MNNGKMLKQVQQDRIFDLFEKKKIFKLVLGLGNRSCEEIYELSRIYAAAGCDMFDVNASENAIEALKKALNDTGREDALICISIGLEGDIHTKKAVVNEKKCCGCAKCAKKCPRDAIFIENGKAHVLAERCIGCGKCKCSAISYVSEESSLPEAVRLAKKYNADCVELHVSTKKSPKSAIEFILKNLDCPLSLCLDRRFYSNEKLAKLIKKVKKLKGDSNFIIQADGVPMSGGDDSLNSTLQAVAMAHLVQDFGTYILLSGGTNSKTAKLANDCGLRFNGVGVGSYARKIVKNLPFVEAVRAAKELVSSVF